MTALRVTGCELRVADYVLRAFRLWIWNGGPPWRDGFNKIHQRATPEELQLLFTIIVKQVWARDFGLN
jgi:hypothetical protein